MRGCFARRSPPPPAGLYVAQLNAERAFAVALHIHERLGGLDPQVLRERALDAGLRAPMMVGVAPIALLSRALETFVTPEGGRLRTGAMREMAAEGAVPVVILERDAAEVTTLATIEEETESAPVTSRHTMEDLHGWFGPTVRAEA